MLKAISYTTGETLFEFDDKELREIYRFMDLTNKNCNVVITINEINDKEITK